MAQQTYSAVIPVSAPTKPEELLAEDWIYGRHFLAQNNTAYDCNLLIWKETGSGSKPIQLAVRAGSSVTYGGVVGHYAVYYAGSNSSSQGVKPAGYAGGYTGPGAIQQPATVGYLTIVAWNEPVPINIPQSNFSTVTASIANPLPAGTNHIGSVSLDGGSSNIGNVGVTALPALPAGANNIGKVDVAALPALPTGANNIGKVDVAALPALPAGANNIGKVDVAALPPVTIAAGSNTIGKVTMTGSVNVAQKLSVRTTMETMPPLWTRTVMGSTSANSAERNCMDAEKIVFWIEGTAITGSPVLSLQFLPVEQSAFDEYPVWFELMTFTAAQFTAAANNRIVYTLKDPPGSQFRLVYKGGSGNAVTIRADANVYTPNY